MATVRSKWLRFIRSVIKLQAYAKARAVRQVYAPLLAEKRKERRLREVQQREELIRLREEARQAEQRRKQQQREESARARVNLAASSTSTKTITSKDADFTGHFSNTTPSRSDTRPESSFSGLPGNQQNAPQYPFQSSHVLMDSAQIQRMIDSAIESATKPLKDRIDTLEKTVTDLQERLQVQKHDTVPKTPSDPFSVPTETLAVEKMDSDQTKGDGILSSTSFVLQSPTLLGKSTSKTSKKKIATLAEKTRTTPLLSTFSSEPNLLSQSSTSVQKKPKSKLLHTISNIQEVATPVSTKVVSQSLSQGSTSSILEGVKKTNNSNTGTLSPLDLLSRLHAIQPTTPKISEPLYHKDATEKIDLITNLDGAVSEIRKQFMEAEDKFEFGKDNRNSKMFVLVRGKLCSALLKIYHHGVKIGRGGSRFHAFEFLEKFCSTVDKDDSPNRTTLTSGVQAIKSIEGLGKRNDLRFRALVCYGLNTQKLADWADAIPLSDSLLIKSYESTAVMRDIKVRQKMKDLLLQLDDFPFTLQLDFELTMSDM